MKRQRNRPSVFLKTSERTRSSRSSKFIPALLFLVLAGQPAFGDSEEATLPTTEADAVAETATEPEVDTKKVPAKAAAPPPIGVRFGEPLEGERFRVSYSYERIRKEGLLISDDRVSPSNLFNRVPPSVVYQQASRSLDIDVHTLQLAYAPHPRATLIVEVPFLHKKLRSRADTGLTSQVRTDGVGDIGFALVVPFIRKGNESSHFHLGLDVPTGSIRRGGSRTPDSYDSQIGNGTVDLEWGWTYRGFKDRFSWGGQVFGQHPVGRNGRDYREGSRFEASLWGAFEVLEGLSGSLRVGWEKQNNIWLRRGIPNSDITDTSDNPKARGGTRFTILSGLALEIPQVENQRLALEFGLPFYQDLDGPQLEQDWSVKAGWQWGF